jgi:hypothetical protein
MLLALPIKIGLINLSFVAEIFCADILVAEMNLSLYFIKGITITVIYNNKSFLHDVQYLASLYYYYYYYYMYIEHFHFLIQEEFVSAEEFIWF